MREDIIRVFKNKIKNFIEVKSHSLHKFDVTFDLLREKDAFITCEILSNFRGRINS